MQNEYVFTVFPAICTVTAVPGIFTISFSVQFCLRTAYGMPALVPARLTALLVFASNIRNFANMLDTSKMLLPCQHP